MNLNDVAGFFRTFTGIFSPAFSGLLLAFILSVPKPGIARRLTDVFPRLKEKTVDALSLTACVAVLVCLLCVLAIPQLTASVKSICTGKGKLAELGNSAELADIEAGSVYYDLIEVMTCKTGCVGGAGQPYGLLPVKHQRSAGLYEADRTSLIKRSESNPIATDMLKGMLKGRTHELLHVLYKSG